ncbi:hypothetical protein CHH59_12480 [Shouchella clausii]|uniref:tyrosine-type recombinase/integrase n=1 Tax=Shouchella clausii TaxID=79880 RepID=UPI000BA582E9|nr:site-specific integrase [Shouchella clausii]PAF13660.1 hypothetical protein CHH59_12480 [Shouchella clausii]
MAKGSIEKRGEYTWRLRIDLGFRPNGKRNRPSRKLEIDDPSLMKMSAKCEKYADAGKKLREYLDDRLADFKREVLSAEYIRPERTTFTKFVKEHWMPKYASDTDNLSEYTLVVYKQHLSNHILPYFGTMELDEIQTMHVVDFVAYLKTPEARKDGKSGTLGSNTQRYVLRVLRNILARALEWKFIKSNPSDGVKLPKPPATNVDVYDESEIVDIMKALNQQPTQWRLLILGAFLGGLRRGEIVALEIKDCDFKNNSIMIDENIPAKINGRHLLKSPKNETSMRRIKMPEWYMKELHDYATKTWKKQRWDAGTTWKAPEDRQFLFHKGDGVPYHPNTPTARWRKFLEDNGFRYIKLHGLRHTSATYLLEQGLTTRAVAERLGHRNERTLLTTYSHVTKSMEERAAAEFDRFANRPKTNI